MRGATGGCGAKGGGGRGGGDGGEGGGGGGEKTVVMPSNEVVSTSAARQSGDASHWSLHTIMASSSSLNRVMLAARTP